MNENIEETMLDLLCKKAVYGLDAGEERQLADLQAKAGVKDESQSFELVAASIGMANLDTREEMPQFLRSRILADANRHFSEQAEMATPRLATPVSERGERASIFNWLGWAVAAAACIALALTFYNSRPTVNNVAIPAAEMRQRLMETAPDLARGSWGAGNVKEVAPTGDVVWSDTRQDGYMRLSGLPVNDPAKEVYQLWIFDETQDEKTPIDGGTFSVDSTGEVIIPIKAKLPPRNTKMYAITVEKAPGVVVSDRKKLVALAKRET